MARQGSRNYYDILEVSQLASMDDIKRAYRRQARNLHPDLNPGADAQQQFQLLQEAWAVLRDPVERTSYDRGLGLGTDWVAEEARGRRTPAAEEARSAPRGEPGASSDPPRASARPDGGASPEDPARARTQAPPREPRPTPGAKAPPDLEGDAHGAEGSPLGEGAGRRRFTVGGRAAQRRREVPAASLVGDSFLDPALRRGLVLGLLGIGVILFFLSPERGAYFLIGGIGLELYLGQRSLAAQLESIHHELQRRRSQG